MELKTAELLVQFEASGEIPAEAALIGVPVMTGFIVPDGAAALDSAFLETMGFEAKVGQVQTIASDGVVVVAVGMGDPGDIDVDVMRRAGAAFARATGHATTVATTLVSAAPDLAGAARAVVTGMALARYRFDQLRSKDRPRFLDTVVVVGASSDDVRAGQVEAQATARARDWVNEPPRTMTPTRLADIAVELGGAAGLQVEVWDENRIAAERLGGLSGVAAGADQPARLVRLVYQPSSAPDDAAQVRTVALVGKGITFDSGGLSLKTPGGMETMKSDMGGAAAVLAAMCALRDLDVSVRVLGYLCLTENMPSGTAIHPGDVLEARNGMTIEVLNTDAEGRLVLADGLSLAVEDHPDAIIDIATLTGAQRVALGSGVAAVLSNDDALSRQIEEAGARAGEPFWRLPLWPAYRRQLDSDVADIKNIGAAGAAGTIIGALFLQDFVDETPWAHLDIAAPSWSDADEGYLTKGGTGWGARTFIELLTGWPEHSAGETSGRSA